MPAYLDEGLKQYAGAESGLNAQYQNFFNATQNLKSRQTFIRQRIAEILAGKHGSLSAGSPALEEIGNLQSEVAANDDKIRYHEGVAGEIKKEIDTRQKDVSGLTAGIGTQEEMYKAFGLDPAGTQLANKDLLLNKAYGEIEGARAQASRQSILNAVARGARGGGGESQAQQELVAQLGYEGPGGKKEYGQAGVKTEQGIQDEASKLRTEALDTYKKLGSQAQNIALDISTGRGKRINDIETARAKAVADATKRKDEAETGIGSSVASTLGGLAGAVGGFFLGGPAGAMAGYQGGSALSGGLYKASRPRR